MGNRTLPVWLAGLLTFGTLLISARNEPQAAGAAIPGGANSQNNLGGRMPPSFDQEVARVVAEVDRIEADTLCQLEHTALDRQGQVRTLGKVLLFDKHLSVNQNEACSFCHTPETGFTGPIQSLNLTTVSYPGSVRTRFSDRKPQSYMYAPFAPVLHYNALQGDIEGAAAISQLGLQNVDVPHHPTDGGFPSINFSNGTGFMPIGRDHVGNTLSTTKQITDNLTYIRGKHTFRTGADYRWVRFAVPEIETPSDDYGLFTFNGALTGNTFGDFLQGLPDTAYFAVTGPRNNAGGPEMGLYGQDEWQVNSRLTVNAGLRWEWLPPFVDQHGIQANFDPIRNTVIVNNVLYRTLGGPVPAFLQSFNACNAAPPGFSAPADAGYVPSASLPCTAVVSNGQEGVPAGLRQTYRRNFDPRVSIAFRPFRDNKTVFRAGFGIFTVINLGQLQNNNESNPQSSVHTYQNSVGSNGAPLFQFPNTIAASQLVQVGGGTIQQATDPRYRDPQSAQWNVTIERELTPSTSLRVSYVGMNSYRLNVTVNWNQIAP